MNPSTEYAKGKGDPALKGGQSATQRGQSATQRGQSGTQRGQSSTQRGQSSTQRPRWVVSGAIAGAISALVFTIVHDILISDIWSMLAVMLVAGALCGACLSWSYSLLVKRPALKNWLGYNALYDGLLMLLGFVSTLMFEPVTTMAAVTQLNGPPDALIGQAMPVTAVFTLLMGLTISLVYGFRWSRFGAALLTSTVLVLLLGLNVSVIGLVSIPRGSWYLIGEMYGLILMLNGVYVAVLAALEWKRLLGVPGQEGPLVVDNDGRDASFDRAG